MCSLSVSQPMILKGISLVRIRIYSKRWCFDWIRILIIFSAIWIKKIGLENVMIALTADHGIAPIPAESAKLGVASTRLDLDAFTAAVDESFNARFSPG